MDSEFDTRKQYIENIRGGGRKIRFFFLSWRDIKSPLYGGAEVHTYHLMQAFQKEGCDVIHFSPRYDGLSEKETVDGITYIRKGGVLSVIFHAARYYVRHAKEIDFVVDQCNSHRFFSRLWVSKNKRIFYIHQLTREIWDLTLPFPFGWIGRKTESFMLRLQKKDWTIALSESTKEDLLALGFDEKKVTIIPIAIPEKIRNIPLDPQIHNKKNFIYVGRYAKYKGINDVVEAFGIVKKKYADEKLYLVGREDIEVLNDQIRPIAGKWNLTYGRGEENDVILTGFVEEEVKYEYMRGARVLLFPSKREGWGMIVTEAAALGTPSIVYDAPGCRDAVDRGRTGYLCSENSPENLAHLMCKTLEEEDAYRDMRINAYQFAQGFSWENNQRLVKAFLEKIDD